MSESELWRQSYLGRSLLAMPRELRPEELSITYSNVGAAAVGLSTLYNRAIESTSPGTILLFVHDDVFIHDPFVCERLVQGLHGADVLGLAGNRNETSEPSWALAFEGEALRCTGWQSGGQFAGAVSHGQDRDLSKPPAVSLGIYGPPSAPVELLDGLFLAARAGALRDAGVSFDERFAFHLYDLDFCRQARRAGLSLRTTPILVTHGSPGDYASADWRAAARLYLDKWAAIERSDALYGRATRTGATA
jgi:hypothetical protein